MRFFTGGNYEELEGAHKGAINNLAWLDSTGLVSASNDETIKLWTFLPDPPTLALESTLEGHKDCVLNVAVTSDRRVVSCCHDSTCRVWDAKSQRIIRRLVGHSRVVYAAALSPIAGLRRTLTCGHDNIVCLWDASGDLVHKFEKVHSGWNLDFSWSPNGVWFVTASSDNTMKLFRAALPPQNFVYYTVFQVYTLLAGVAEDVVNFASRVAERLQ